MMMKLMEKVRENATTARVAIGTAVTSRMLMCPTLIAFAEEPAGGSNLLDGEVMTVITSGFSSLAATATQVLAVAVVTGISVIGMTAAAKYAMKKIKGTLNSAA